MAAPITSPSQTTAFERIVSVRYDAGELSVLFENGQIATIAIDQLAGYGIRLDEWPSVEPEEFHIRVATARGSVEIPWDVLRYTSSETFRHEWDEVMRNASKQVGRRFRSLREQRGITVAQLAERIGADAESILGLESGSISGDLDLEQRVLSGLECNRSDLRMNTSQ